MAWRQESCDDKDSCHFQLLPKEWFILGRMEGNNPNPSLCLLYGCTVPYAPKIDAGAYKNRHVHVQVLHSNA